LSLFKTSIVTGVSRRVDAESSLAVGGLFVAGALDTVIVTELAAELAPWSSVTVSWNV